MTAFDRFDPFERRITEAIDEIAAAGPPAYLDDVLQQTARTSQRPRWMFAGTRLPADAVIRLPGLARPVGRRAVLVLALVALATITALVAGALLSPKPSPLGGGGWINVSSSSTDIHILTPDGATDRSFTRGHGSCPKLSPDGSEVGYKIRFSGLFVTRLADEEHRRVASSEEANNFGYMEGVWSPNRAYLSFRDNGAGGQRLQVVSVFDDEPSIRTLFSTTTEELLTEAAWSADSKLVAVGYGREGEFRVAVVDLDGVVQATHGPFSIDSGTAEMLSLAWSPDGARLVYQDFDGGSPVVHVIDLPSGTPREPVAVGFGDYYAASPWSPDGRWLAVARADGDLVIASADGTTRVTGPAISTEPTGSIPRWSPVADVVAVMTPTGLATVAADSGTHTHLRAIPEGIRWGFAWSPDGSRIVVAEDHGASGGLLVTNLDATGRSAAVQIGTFPSIGESGLCVSWDAPTNP
jgi:Tol biopolymer transport system component